MFKSTRCNPQRKVPKNFLGKKVFKIQDEELSNGVNAIIHKDYRNPTDVIIKIYDNRIEITNPGSLMGGLKP